MEVLFVAAKREMLDAFLRAAEVARLRVQDVEVLPLILERTLRRWTGEAVAAINIGNGLCQILISTAGTPRLARIFPRGVYDALRAVAANPDLPAGEPGEPDFTLSQVDLLAWSGRLAGEIRSSLNYYQSQTGARPVEAVRLSGRGAALSGLPEALAQQLDLPVTVLEPLTDTQVIRDGAGLPLTPDYTLSLCLALQREK